MNRTCARMVWKGLQWVHHMRSTRARICDVGTLCRVSRICLRRRNVRRRWRSHLACLGGHGQNEPGAIAQYTDQCKRVTPELERVHREEIRSWVYDGRIVDALLDIGARAPYCEEDPDGLVILQQLFMEVARKKKDCCPHHASIVSVFRMRV